MTDLGFDAFSVTGRGAHGLGADRLAQRASELARSDRTEDAAQRFEELLATVLVKELRRALPDGLFGQGPGADVFEGWFDEHLGKSLARDGALGLGEIVREGLLRKAEERNREGER